eukprot:CAMPEP_0117758720 /NCGR_PEP_ID=MMETSP0947-20121206/15571_1 /TAXON_ID=44440 /ORGANISM="Chattonella subsalsa, Strain CCMP2191" /LENGTH=449 /DNA_ID=CAMNT_0005579011 /DNA_START=267 /DNA_END=1616 /DNA_ORIENTATION=+
MSAEPVDEEKQAMNKIDVDDVVLSEVKLKQALKDIDDAKDAKQKRIEEEEAARKELQSIKENIRSKAREAVGDDEAQPLPSDADQSTREKTSNKLPLPFLDIESLGLKGDWEEMGGNYLLRPPEDVPVKALIHFLGGAFVGAAPHLTYKYLLEGLAEKGYLIVATPYPLDFDYLETCDGIISKFEKAAIPLAKEYGAIPVIGVGHSCGALLQLLITSLFPDTPRAGNAIISFNNKPASEAIPGFEQTIVPFVTTLLVPETEEASEQQKAVLESLSMLRQSARNILQASADLPFVPAFLGKELLPLGIQATQILDQIPGIFQSIADGAREFSPTPAETKEVIRRLYRARRTLLIKFDNDSLDETEDIQGVIAQAKSIYRMKRPMIQSMDLSSQEITGTHITPLTQNIFLDTPFDEIDPLISTRNELKSNFLQTVDQVSEVLVDWLEEGLQ